MFKFTHSSISTLPYFPKNRILVWYSNPTSLVQNRDISDLRVLKEQCIFSSTLYLVSMYKQDACVFKSGITFSPNNCTYNFKWTQTGSCPKSSQPRTIQVGVWGVDQNIIFRTQDPASNESRWHVFNITPYRHREIPSWIFWISN